ncbi:hypothetical protein AB1Y20_002081 [Prymnesium parvum]|uniref:Sugar phosphate transporter domain-containing protein n=1 Tax=Prymnesium parvum TaxID=97485 RepID=A0AB34J8E7_PRYPA
MARELLLLLLAPGCVSALRAHAHLHLRQLHAPMTRTIVAVAPIEAGHQIESSAVTSTLVRATRFQKSVKKLSSSTSVHPQRIAHAACGVVALVLGAKLMVNCAVEGWASPMNHIEVISCAVFSVISSLLGVIRLEWNNPNEAARNTFIWPVAAQNMWILGVFVSDYTNNG